MTDKPPQITVVSRTEWGAKPPQGEVEPVTHPLERVFITMDTASRPCYNKEDCMEVVADLQTRHMMNDNAPDIRYNFLVGGDGNIYEGRGWHQKPQLAKEEKYFEDKSLDIAYIGTYEVHPLKMYGWLCDSLLLGVEKKYLRMGEFEVYDKADLLRAKGEETKKAEEENNKKDERITESNINND